MTSALAAGSEQCTAVSEPAPLRAIVDHLSAMVAYWDADQRCRFANRAYETWFGVDPSSLIGQDMRSLLGALYTRNQPYIEGALRGEAQEFEREIPDPRGGPPRQSLAQYIPDVVDGSVRGFYVLVTDITRLKQAERALLEMEHQVQSSERLAALATLAAGIAHEINNPLAAVLAHTELALEALSGPVCDKYAAKADLIEARASTLRVRDIVQSMKLLARGDATKQETVDVNDTLERSIDLAGASLRYNARVVRELEPGLFIHGNASQLAQVFVNLLTNAAQALPSESSKTNEIRVAARRDGASVVVEVSDNGCGIAPEHLVRVFEPFFTTKAVGTGMGLGLSISNTIVKAFGGELSASSTVGKGSVFRVVLPAAPAPPLGLTRTAPPERDVAEPGRGSEPSRPRVLIIDDEVAVAQTLHRILSKDCDVVVTHHGRDAIPLLVAESNKFDLVLCDLMMPEPSGEDLYAEVTRRRPELAPRFVFMTGGAFTNRGRHFLESVPVEVLEKPFDLKRLRALVAKCSPKP